MATAARVVTWPAHVAGGWASDMLESLPEDSLRDEIVDGTLLVSPAPRPSWCGNRFR